MEIKKVKTLRKLESEAQYEKYRACSEFPECYICDAEQIKKYKYWKIIENQFPYDEIATMHHMVVSLYHKTEEELNSKEVQEYKKIKDEIHENYDIILENTYKNKSIPKHHHLHILRVRERVAMDYKKRPSAVFF